MRRKLLIIFLLICMTVSVLGWIGVGYYSSSSVGVCLRTELEKIYGPEYTGKAVVNGTEDMVFTLETKSWFMTNWDLRNALGIDYKYECKVIFTNYVDGKIESVRTITYQAIDPMGVEEMTDSAYLNLSSKVESIKNYHK